MKVNRFTVAASMLCFLFLAFNLQAQTEIRQTYVVLEVNSSSDQFLAGGINNDNASQFGGVNFGVVSSLILNGGEIKTRKSGGGDVTGAEVNYNVHLASDGTGSFSSINLPFSADLGGGDQRWQQLGTNIDLLSGLLPGTYHLEIFWRSTTNGSDMFDTNFGNNYTATFTVETPGFYDDNGTLTICPAGSFCPGDGTIALCPTGEYSDVEGSSVCTACEAGTYQDQPGATSCNACTTTCPAGQIISTPCTATSNTVCFACDDNSQLASLTASGLVLSPAFDPLVLSYSASTECLTSVDVTATAVSASSTLSGSTGTVSLNSGVNVLTVTVTSECLIFATDYTITIDNSTSPGFYDDNGVCTECPAGSFCPGDGTVSLCPAGRFSATTGASECVPCSQGFFQASEGATSCEPCAAGTAQNQVGASSCTACPAGTYQDQQGSIDCIACDAGSTSPPGASACTPCAAGEYVDNGVCVVCPPGSFCPGDGTKTLCPAGRYSDISGATECIDCELGRFSSTEGATSCTACPAGTFSNVTGASACADCPAGTFQANEGAVECLACDPGFCQDETGQTECTTCGSADLVLTPSLSAVTQCDEFSVLVSVESTDTYNTVETRLTFDPNTLQVTAVTAPDTANVLTSNPPFDVPFGLPVLDNINGSVVFISTASTSVTGNSDFIRIFFEVVGNGGTTSITPVTSGDDITRIVKTEFIGGIPTPVDILNEALPIDLTLNPDEEDPVFTCPSTASIDVDANCSITIPDLTTGLTGTDNCGPVTFSQSPLAGAVVSTSHNQITTVTITAEDVNANTASCDVSITALDVTSPTVSCTTNDFTISADASCEAVVPDFVNIPSASATNDFSGTQGSGNWSYGQYFDNDVNNFNPLPNFTGFVWNNPGVGETLDFPQLDPNGGHPGFTEDWAVRRWTSPIDGVISVSGDYFDRDVNCGNGVNVLILKNGEELLNDFVNSGSSVPYSLEIAVVTGDVIDFAIDPIGNDASCDDTHFTANIGAVISADDNCSVTLSQSPAAGTAITTGTTTVIITATDGANLTSSCSVDVTVVDDTPPVISCPTTIFVDNDPGLCSAVVTFAATATDNCGSATVTYSQNSGTVFNVGTTTVTATADDGNGNTSQCSFDVVVTDMENPVVTGSISNTIIEACDQSFAPAAATTVAELEALDGDLLISDNCAADSDLSVTVSESTTGMCPWVITRTYQVTDQFSNVSSTFDHVITIDDTTPPVFNQEAADLTVECDGTGNLVEFNAWLSNFGGANASDNCGNEIYFNNYDEVTNGFSDDCGSTGSVTVTFTAVDMCGNESPTTATFTIIDTTNPTASAPAAVNVQCFGDVPAVDITVVTDEADNCGTAVVAHVGDVSNGGAGTTASPLIITRTYSVTDGCLNSINLLQFIAVVDDIAPVADAASLADVTAECEVASVTPPTATDNCEGTITGTTTTTFPITTQGTTTITWTFDDGNGNTSSQTQDVVIDDVTDPVAPTLADVTAECSATVPVPTTTDVCAGTVTGTTSDPLSYSGEGTYTVTWNFDDGNGNDIDVVQTVIIDDETDPVISSCPSNISVSNDADDCGAVVNFSASATDNCGGTPTITYSQDPGTFFPVGNTTVTVTADDGNGNTSTCSFEVTVNDTELPEISCLGALNVTVNQTNTYLVSGGEFDPTFSDNCSGATVSHNAAVVLGTSGPSNASLDGWELPLGTSIIRFTALDAAGNTSFCDVVINVDPAVISGNVTLNGACLPLDMTVSVYEAGTPNPSPVLVATFTNVEIAGDGSFSFDATGIAPGSYDIYIKPENYLTKFAGNYTVDGLPTNVTATALVPGDISVTEDDQINGDDLSLIIGAYNTEDGVDASYNSNADVNCDGFVDALDLSLLIFFFFDGGDSATN